MPLLIIQFITRLYNNLLLTNFYYIFVNITCRSTKACRSLTRLIIHAPLISEYVRVSSLAGVFRLRNNAVGTAVLEC